MLSNLKGLERCQLVPLSGDIIHHFVNTLKGSSKLYLSITLTPIYFVSQFRVEIKRHTACIFRILFANDPEPHNTVLSVPKLSKCYVYQHQGPSLIRISAFRSVVLGYLFISIWTP